MSITVVFRKSNDASQSEFALSFNHSFLLFLFRRWTWTWQNWTPGNGSLQLRQEDNTKRWVQEFLSGWRRRLIGSDLANLMQRR